MAGQGRVAGARRLRVGIIGCGIGGYHGYAYAQAADEYELVAICDIKPAVFPRFYERSGVAPGSVKEYTSHRAMLEAERLDVVSVATPVAHHAGPTIDAAEAGVRGILVEKPLATSLEDADRMMAAIGRSGAKVSVDHTRSWWPSFQRARALVREGALGGLTRVVVHMGGRRSMLFQNGTHMLDTMGYFAGARPVWVIAAHERGFEEYGLGYAGGDGLDPMADPASTMIVEFENGVRGIFNAAKGTPAIYEVELQGPLGRIVLGQREGRYERCAEPEGEPVAEAAPWTAGAGGQLGQNLIPAVRELATMVRGEARSSSPPERALDTLEIILAALLSQARGSAKVRLPLPRG